MSFEYLNPGIQLVGTFGPFSDKVRIFLLSSGDECALVEMPPIGNDDFHPWKKVRSYIQENKLRLKFMTVSHGHWDHFKTYPEFHREFPKVPIIVNSLIFKEEKITNFLTSKDLEEGKFQDPSIIQNRTILYCFKDKLFETNLNGEPLYLIQAPKHSWGDTPIIFRGTMLTGDWWLGSGDPNKNNIPKNEIKQSLDFLIQFCKEKSYNIHTLMAAHDNELRRNVNFIELMEHTKVKKNN